MKDKCIEEHKMCCCDKKTVAIVRGTTPAFRFTFKEDISAASVILLTFVQKKSIVKEYDKDDLEIDGDTLTLYMSQEDTFLFDEEDAAVAQVRALYPDGVAVGCEPYAMPVVPVLNNTVLEEGE